VSIKRESAGSRDCGNDTFLVTARRHNLGAFDGSA